MDDVAVNTQETEGKPTMDRRLSYIVANIFSRFFSLSLLSSRSFLDTVLGYARLYI